MKSDFVAGFFCQADEFCAGTRGIFDDGTKINPGIGIVAGQITTFGINACHAPVQTWSISMAVRIGPYGGSVVQIHMLNDIRFCFSEDFDTGFP